MDRSGCKRVLENIRKPDHDLSPSEGGSRKQQAESKKLKAKVN
jgi:hypothetical protein